MDLSKFDFTQFSVKHIADWDTEKQEQYTALLEKTYRPLGFLKPSVYPSKNSLRHALYFKESMEGIFSITPLEKIADASYRALVPFLQELPKDARIAEISNVILRKRVRGGVALGVMLYSAARCAVNEKYQALVGLTRFQTLPFFVDFGVSPVFHAPLHCMGDDSINDFAIYFDISSKKSIDYMHIRASKFFEKEFTLARIRANYYQENAFAIREFS